MKTIIIKRVAHKGKPCLGLFFPYDNALKDIVKKLPDARWLRVILKRQTFETIYFRASHPFEDGNGRAGRLLEKWFVAEKLGKKAWYTQNELNYYNNVNDYYKNLNQLGMFYDQLDYSKAIPFLLMLPNSISIK
jgi:fido (protein-threonine AMPylation protein)